MQRLNNCGGFSKRRSLALEVKKITEFIGKNPIPFGKENVVKYQGTITVRVNGVMTCALGNDCHPDGCLACVRYGYEFALEELNYEIVNNNVEIEILDSR